MTFQRGQGELVLEQGLRSIHRILAEEPVWITLVPVEKDTFNFSH